VIIDASGVMEVDLSALAVIDELVTEMGKQGVDVFIASASTRMAKSLEAYDLLVAVGGLPLVTLDVRALLVSSWLDSLWWPVESRGLLWACVAPTLTRPITPKLQHTSQTHPPHHTTATTVPK
jgi:MFS superfamily sulfate permease-like transporter